MIDTDTPAAAAAAAAAAAVGKRRYDRKQAGYGGQTKPVFHKKVRNYAWCPALVLWGGGLLTAAGNQPRLTHV